MELLASAALPGFPGLREQCRLGTVLLTECPVCEADNQPRS